MSGKRHSEFLDRKGFKYLPGSQANFFMVDVHRPGREFSQNMLKEKVAIGRTWAALPTFVRVTVGTADEMAKFHEAFMKCMDLPVAPRTTAYLDPAAEFYAPSELDRV